MGGRAGRAPAIWTPATVQLIAHNFVPLAIRSGEQYRKDAEGDFIRQCGLKLTGTGGNMVVVTASGKQLGGKNGESSDVLQAWKEWNRLPAAERLPGAVAVGERGTIDGVKTLPTPPENGLILKLYYRNLARGADGEPRHVNAKDFVHNHAMAKDPNNIHEIGFIDLVIGNKAFHEASPDFMWLTEAEWKSLLPDHPSKGDVKPVSAAIAERFFRYQLVPTIGFGEANAWEKKDFRGGNLTLTVESVAEDKVRLRLEGSGRLGNDYETVEKSVKEKRDASGYEPRILGYLDFQPTKKTITRFDIVAFGDTYGMLGGDYRYFYRPGRQPLGVAFELVDGKRPANRVPPRTGRLSYQEYFSTGR